MLNELKVLANKKDISYQSLIKVYLAEKSPKNEKPASGSVHERLDLADESAIVPVI
jgi:hypothetical protein